MLISQLTHCFHIACAFSCLTAAGIVLFCQVSEGALESGWSQQCVQGSAGFGDCQCTTAFGFRRCSRGARRQYTCEEAISSYIILGLYQELAKVLIRREKNVEAHAMMQRCFDESVRIRGPDHAATLDVGVELG